MLANQVVPDFGSPAIKIVLFGYLSAYQQYSNKYRIRKIPCAADLNLNFLMSLSSVRQYNKSTSHLVQVDNTS